MIIHSFILWVKAGQTLRHTMDNAIHMVRTHAHISVLEDSFLKLCSFFEPLSLSSDFDVCANVNSCLLLPCKLLGRPCDSFHFHP